MNNRKNNPLYETSNNPTCQSFLDKIAENNPIDYTAIPGDDIHWLQEIHKNNPHHYMDGQLNPICEEFLGLVDIN